MTLGRPTIHTLFGASQVFGGKESERSLACVVELSHEVAEASGQIELQCISNLTHLRHAEDGAIPHSCTLYKRA